MSDARTSIRRTWALALAVQVALAVVLVAWLVFALERGASLRAQQARLNRIGTFAVDLVVLASEYQIQPSARVLRQWESTASRIDGLIPEIGAKADRDGGSIDGTARELRTQYERVRLAMDRSLAFGGDSASRNLHLVQEAQRLARTAETAHQRIEPRLYALGRLSILLPTGILLLSFAILLITGHGVRRVVIGPLAAMIRSLERIGRGELTTPVPIPPVVELASLGQAAETMRRDLHAVTVSRDALDAEIVERRRAEQEAIELYEQLRTTQRKAIQLEKLSALGVFVGGVAHEISNPLMAIDNYLSYLERKSQPGRHQDVLAKARHEVQRIERIVRDLLLHSRAPSETGSGVCDLEQVVEAVRERFGHRLDEAGIRLETGVEAGVVRPAIGAEALLQVLTNIVGNAIDALNGQDAPVIRIDARLDAGTIEIRVTDNGPGVSPSIQDKVFDPFFTTKPPGRGTGLGLGITRQLLQETGGDVTVEPAPDGGARFNIRIPVAGSPAEWDQGELDVETRSGDR